MKYIVFISLVCFCINSCSFDPSLSESISKADDHELSGDWKSLLPGVAVDFSIDKKGTFIFTSLDSPTKDIYSLYDSLGNHIYIYRIETFINSKKVGKKYFKCSLVGKKLWKSSSVFHADKAESLPTDTEFAIRT